MTPSTPHEPSRFLPGAMIAGRYRVVALLGRGGMGEVYRADDTKLGEPVALKFLPERLENDGGLRERFLSEARLARKVAHPNVCRVYDLGEVDGRLFLSMEYVDGEDLATLLRRIGRLPEEKAVQLAQQMCAGLQAVHEQGIVHRDLKPANVMIDGRGRARITDFGLAAAAATVTGREAAAGTPAYMAPEQLAGQEATTRSDVYALGLVLHELFTGHPAFDGGSWAEQLSAKQSRTASRVSQTTPGIDPAIEQVLRRCLAPEPRERPPSASAVALALPGGDPIAAALAAGETPSPEMVAQAGGDVHFAPAAAWGWFGLFAAALVAMFLVAPRAYQIQRVPIAKPPAVLLDRAREVAAALGWTGRPRDEWTMLVFDQDQGDFLSKRFGGGHVLEHLRRFPRGTFRMLYRRSPKVMAPLNVNGWTPSAEDPPLTEPGMLTLYVDGEGRLTSMKACPEVHDSTAVPAAEPAWGRLFALSGLDSAAFVRVAPEWTPAVYADHRAAWLGRVPGDTSLVMRVEAASCRGRPVMFRPVYPWTAVPEDSEFRAPGGGNLVGWVVWSLFLGLLVLAAITARRNLHDGRADVSGTLRMATASAVLVLTGIWASMHYASDPSLLAGRVLSSVGRCSLIFLVTSVLYLTLEPIVRRTWPTMLVSWVRLLDGRFRDSLLGRDVLAGLGLGVLLQLLALAGAQVWAASTGEHALNQFVDSPGSQTTALMSTGAALTVLVRDLLSALQVALTGAALAALFTQLTRRRVLALVLSGATMLVIELPGFAPSTFMLILIPLVVAVGLTLMVRFGFVTLIAFLTAMSVMSDLPIAAPGSSWYWPTTAVGTIALAGLALWCLRAMLARRRSAAPHDSAFPSHRGSGTPSHAIAGGGAIATGSPATRERTPASQWPTDPSPPRAISSQLPTELSPPPGEEGGAPRR